MNHLNLTKKLEEPRGFQWLENRAKKFPMIGKIRHKISNGWKVPERGFHIFSNDWKNGWKIFQ